MPDRVLTSAKAVLMPRPIDAKTPEYTTRRCFEAFSNLSDSLKSSVKYGCSKDAILIFDCIITVYPLLCILAFADSML